MEQDSDSGSIADLQFYPTPQDLAKRAWAKFKNRNIIRLLEPSAGDGALAAVGSDREDRYYSNRRTDIDCCEIDLSKHAALKEHGFNVVGLDFMQFASASAYSHILMNPPFREGVRHVLKAWSLLWNGEIVAIINAESIKNPYSKERQMLVSLIDKHGEVEFIESAFAGPDARRPTEVEVALVYLRKEADYKLDIVGTILEDLRRDSTEDESLAKGFMEHQAVALPASVIENTVLAFNAAVKAMREEVFAEARAGYYAALLGDTMAVRNGDAGKSHKDNSIGQVQKTLMNRYIDLKDRAWSGILRSSNVTSRLSSNAQRHVESEFESIKKLEFTVSNIYGFLCGIVESQGEMQLQMACDIFDKFTLFHSENMVFFKGWKSNDRHRTCGMRLKTTRIVLPGHKTESYSHGLPFETCRMLKDFDLVFAMLDGRREPEYGLNQACSDHFNEIRRGARISSSYFDVRYYPGAGTLHLFPSNKDLIDRLNRLVGKRRQWIPPEGERVSDAFWLQYDQAEKFDKEIRSEVAKAIPSRNYWYSPLDRMFHGSEAEKEAARQIVDTAITTVLERHGINVDFQIGPSSQQPGQHQIPLLEAA